jgi:hypothetical protein
MGYGGPSAITCPLASSNLSQFLTSGAIAALFRDMNK